MFNLYDRELDFDKVAYESQEDIFDSSKYQIDSSKLDLLLESLEEKLDITNLYFHGTGIKNFKSILKYGILSFNEKQKIGLTGHIGVFNGKDYISLAKHVERPKNTKEGSAFTGSSYLTEKCSIVINANINAFKLKNKLFSLNQKPFYDEFQIKDRIDTKDFIAISIPKSKKELVECTKYYGQITILLKLIREILLYQEELNINLPFITNDGYIIDRNIVKQIVKIK